MSGIHKLYRAASLNINTIHYSRLFSVVLFNKLDWMLRGVLLDGKYKLMARHVFW